MHFTTPDEKTLILLALTFTIIWTLSPAFRWRTRIAAWIAAFIIIVITLIAPHTLT